MVVVYIPTHMRPAVDGRDRVEVAGSTLRQVVAALNAQWPGLEPQLMEGGQIRDEIAVSIDGVVTENDPLEPVGEDAEIHIIPAIAGG